MKMWIGDILAIIFAWVAPFIITGTVIYLIRHYWNEDRPLCYGFIGGYIVGMLMYVSIVPTMFV